MNSDDVFTETPQESAEYMKKRIFRGGCICSEVHFVLDSIRRNSVNDCIVYARETFEHAKTIIKSSRPCYSCFDSGIAILNGKIDNVPICEKMMNSGMSVVVRKPINVNATL